VSRDDGLSGAFRAKRYSARHDHAAAEAFRHFSLADRWGLAGVVEVKLGLAWCHVLRGEIDQAQRKAREAIALAPTQPALRQNLLDLEHAATPSAEDLFRLAGTLVESGKLEDAVSAYENARAIAPDSAPVRFNLGGVLRRLGRNEAAIEQLEAARDLLPEDSDVYVELGLAYMAAGANEKAVAALRRAITLNPDSPESRTHLPGLIRQLELGQRPR
jgi:tetratricopeptide (TPR) repeat protein